MKYRIWTWFSLRGSDFRDTGFFLKKRHTARGGDSEEVLTFDNVEQAKRCAEENIRGNYVIMMDAQEEVIKC